MSLSRDTNLGAARSPLGWDGGCRDGIWKSNLENQAGVSQASAVLLTAALLGITCLRLTSSWRAETWGLTPSRYHRTTYQLRSCKQPGNSGPSVPWPSWHFSILKRVHIRHPTHVDFTSSDPKLVPTIPSLWSLTSACTPNSRSCSCDLHALACKWTSCASGILIEFSQQKRLKDASNS